MGVAHGLSLAGPRPRHRPHAAVTNGHLLLPCPAPPATATATGAPPARDGCPVAPPLVAAPAHVAMLPPPPPTHPPIQASGRPSARPTGRPSLKSTAPAPSSRSCTAAWSCPSSNSYTGWSTHTGAEAKGGGSGCRERLNVQSLNGVLRARRAATGGCRRRALGSLVAASRWWQRHTGLASTHAATPAHPSPPKPTRPTPSCCCASPRTCRMWGRLLGVAFAVPAVYFGARRWISGALARRLGLLFFMGGTQVGWRRLCLLRVW